MVRVKPLFDPGGSDRKSKLQATFSSGVPPDPRRGCGGMSEGSNFSHGGPSNQKEWTNNSLGDRPHEAQSAG